MPPRLPESAQLEKLAPIAEGRYTFERIGEYMGNRTRYLCTCLIDGCKWDTPLLSLLTGTGCRDCKRAKLASLRVKPESSYLERLAPIAEGRYTFERVGDYAGSDKTRYLCTCLIDGHQWETPLAVLLKGHGCKACGMVKNSDKFMKPLEQAELELSAVARDRYTFERIGEYTGNRTRYLCTCLIDGRAWDAALCDLLAGKGCKECGGGLFVEEGERIARVNAVPGVNFRGWIGEFVGAHTRMVCECDEGHRWEASLNHVSNTMSGCPTCYPGGYDKASPGSLYALVSECGAMVKIGISNKPEQRLKTLARDTPFSWNQIAQIDSQDGAQIARFEKELHEATEQAITDAKFDGYTEWRKYNPAILETLELYRAQAV